MDFATWLTFSAAATALLMIPGPTVLLVLAYALSDGRRVAIPTALGVGAGDLIAMTASVLGLGALVLASATLFLAVKWVGAAYLVYLGVKMIWTADRSRLGLPEGAPSVTPRAAFWNATLVTALNPKSILFFIAFVPQFLDPKAPFLPQASILIATFVGLATLNALLYGLLGGRLRVALQRPAILAWITRAGGAALVAMGVATAAIRRAA